MEERFNIGDRVVAIVDSPADNASIHAGDAGTVEYGYGWRVLEAALDFEPDDTMSSTACSRDK